MRQAYEALVASGEIERDEAQQRVVARLDALLDRLAPAAAPKDKPWSLGRLFSGRSRAPEPVRGLYIWGEVGRGKTMLMDMFFAEIPAGIPSRRVHFNAFMNEVHERIFRYRTDLKAGRVSGEDAIKPVGAALAEEARLLCFDEFSVTDIADAMILGRLFDRLFELGVIVVATSNVEPDRLYEGGLNRALFLPFIDNLKRHMEVLRLDARTDYRREKLEGGETYILGTGETARAAMDQAFLRLTGSRRGKPMTLSVKGRTLAVPQAAMGVARFSFAELCEEPRSAADYLAIAQTFHTVLLDDVPRIRDEQRNEAKRFILLIDTLYDRGVKLVLSAAAEPDGLYAATDGREAFEFTRTVSRLIEMRSTDYLARPHASTARSAIVET